jgi:hypothetical protein
VRRGSLLGSLGTSCLLSTTAAIAQTMICGPLGNTCVLPLAVKSPAWTSEMLLSAKNHIVVYF